MARKQWLTIGELTHEGFVNADGVTCYSTNNSEKVLFCSKAGTPPSATSGYAVGCDFFNESTGTHYFNVGSVTSCSFVAVGGTLMSFGSFNSTTAGYGIPISSANTAVLRVYTDDGGVAIAATGSVPDYRSVLGRMLFTHDQTSSFIRDYPLMGHVKAYDAAWDGEQVAGTYGYLELVRSAATMTFGGYGKSAAVMGCVETSGTMTINTNHIVAGLAAISKLAGTGLTQTGKTCGVLVDIYDTTNWSDSTSRSKWGVGMYIPARAADSGILIGDFASSLASGSAIPFTAATTGIVKVYGENTADLTSAYNFRTILGRNLISCAGDTVINQETYGVTGQLVVKNGSLNHYHAGVTGTFETGTLCHVQTSYCAAAVMARPGGSGTTVESGGLLAGFAAVQNMSAITATGTYAAFATHKTAAGVAWPTGLYIQSGSCTKALDITCAAIGATGRTASITGTINNGNLGDGYGAIELQLNMDGTAAGQVTGLSNWINMNASSSGGGQKIIAQDNGIWVSATGTPMSASTAVIGMRMQYVADGGGNPGALYLFDTNIYDNTLTALFQVNAIGDMGGSSGAQTGNDYKVPLFHDYTANQTWYVNIYHT